MVTIISTHPVTKRYNLWHTDPSTHTQTRLWDCTIPGGAGVVNRKSLVTPIGVATEISDDALEKLMQIEAFTSDIEGGFIKVLKRTKARSVDADEQALADMNTEGSGKPITQKDLEKAGAVVNDDGSIDISNGGKNAIIERNQRREKADTPKSRRRK